MFSNVFHMVRIILTQNEHKSNEKRRVAPIAYTCAQKFEVVFLEITKVALMHFLHGALQLRRV